MPHTARTLSFKLLPPLDMIYGVKTSTMLLLIHLLPSAGSPLLLLAWVNVNFDGLVKNNNIAAMEFVIKDAHGSSLFAGTKNLDGPTSSPLILLLFEKVYLKL